MLHLGLRLGGLDHEGAGDRPGHGGRVEAVVDEALGNVLGLDVSGVLERAQVDDELVRAGAVVARVQHLVGVLQPRRHVVGVQDGTPGSLRIYAHSFHTDSNICS